MSKYILIVLILFVNLISVNLFAKQYKVYWRCTNGRLEAVEPYINNNEKEEHFVYLQEKNNINSTVVPVDIYSLVHLPDQLPVTYVLELGDRFKGVVSCKGEIVASPFYYHDKIVFDVSSKAKGCTLIPEGC